MDRAYLDYNATAPLRAEAREAMIAALGATGNASSVHAEGRQARAVIGRARAEIAALVGAVAQGVTFTGGGSEANATVLTPAWTRGGRPLGLAHLVVSAVEHPSVLAGGRFPARNVHVAPVDGDGLVDLDALDRLLGGLDGPALVSVMLANNETGVVQPAGEVARIAHAHDALVHADAVQAIGRMPFDLAASGIDVVTLSAHKLGGPQGVGAIVRAPGRDIAFAPLVPGGGQEARLRAGTENVAAIAGFGAAARAAAFDEGEARRWRGMIARVEAEIGNRAVIFGRGAPRLPQTTCFGVEGASAETLVIALDLAGVAVSSGSACSSGKVGPSHVLAAMAVPDRLAGSAIRVSLGWDCDDRTLDLFATAWRNVISHVLPETTSAA